jgi:hypothetical protein
MAAGFIVELIGHHLDLIFIVIFIDSVCHKKQRDVFSPVGISASD